MTVLHAVEAVLGALRGPWLYLAVGVLGAAECAAMIGMVVPGETAIVLGGVAVGLGQANLAGMVATAVGGAVVGDQVGFVLGRCLGRRLRHGRFAHRVGERRWSRAEALVSRRGGPAVFFGRWVGVLRAAVPAVAGAVGMPRRVFTVWNAAGGVLWASAVVLLGMLAGRAWPTVQAWFGTAAWVVGATVAGAALIWGLHRRQVRRRAARLSTADSDAAATHVGTAAVGGRSRDGETERDAG